MGCDELTDLLFPPQCSGLVKMEVTTAVWDNWKRTARDAGADSVVTTYITRLISHEIPVFQA